MDTGRVFFLPDNRNVNIIRAVTLESHLANVARLAEAWKPSRAYLQIPDHLVEMLKQTRPWLIRSAQRHDEGKRHRFRIEQNEHGEFVYSYRGHRFDVTDDNLYVELLIRLHHNAYSVHEINDAIARLRLEPQFSSLAACFPFDAYALQMCDQLTAEAEIYVLDARPRSTPFMEFKTEKQGEKVVVEPYPFEQDEIRLVIEYADLPVVESPLNPEALTKRVKSESSAQVHSKEVILCPST
jgi:hypothetical protein